MATAGGARDCALPLLSARYRGLGWVLTGLGVALGLLRYYWGVQPRSLEWRVFAFHTAYLQPRWFAVIDKNVAGELAALALLAGLLILAFSREHGEDGSLDALRVRALTRAVQINAGLLAASIIFVFGVGFVAVLAVNMFSTPVLFLVAFRLMRRRAASRQPAAADA